MIFVIKWPSRWYMYIAAWGWWGGGDSHVKGQGCLFKQTVQVLLRFLSSMFLLAVSFQRLCDLNWLSSLSSLFYWENNYIPTSKSSLEFLNDLCKSINLSLVSILNHVYKLLFLAYDLYFFWKTLNCTFFSASITFFGT